MLQGVDSRNRAPIHWDGESPDLGTIAAVIAMIGCYIGIGINLNNRIIIIIVIIMFHCGYFCNCGSSAGNGKSLNKAVTASP